MPLIRDLVSIWLLGASVAMANSSAEIPPQYQALQQELLVMMQADQSAMQAAEQPTTKTLQLQHAERMKVLIAQYGWPTDAMVGESAVQAAWLLVQHADHDKAFQLQVLALMEPLAKNARINPSHYAYLYDRTHQPQRFGTQGECRDGQFQAFALEDAAQLDQRRAAFQLEPFADYQARASRMMCKSH